MTGTLIAKRLNSHEVAIEMAGTNIFEENIGQFH